MSSISGDEKNIIRGKYTLPSKHNITGTHTQNVGFGMSLLIISSPKRSRGLWTTELVYRDGREGC